MPVIVQEVVPGLEQGPVLVTVEYRVEAEHADAFLRAMQQYEHVRRRDGASRWGLYRDLEHADVYLETFIVVSWAEHLRQHERLTRGDSDLEQLVASHARGEPIVRHLIHAESEG
jgi:quinol monooxygenase YgiN